MRSPMLSSLAIVLDGFGTDVKCCCQFSFSDEEAEMFDREFDIERWDELMLKVSVFCFLIMIKVD